MKLKITIKFNMIYWLVQEKEQSELSVSKRISLPLSKEPMSKELTIYLNFILESKCILSPVPKIK